NFHLYQLEGVRSLILATTFLCVKKGLPRCQKNMTEDNSLSFHIKRSITDIYVVRISDFSCKIHTKISHQKM
uniref:Uncharacterized protein n=1 Tax=Pundamilia nyererei TaxID=303518 RepID=A0A3B4F0M3_9CICH